MKKFVLAALAVCVLGTTAAEAAIHHHRHRVCVWHHHHRVCHWR